MVSSTVERIEVVAGQNIVQSGFSSHTVDQPVLAAIHAVLDAWMDTTVGRLVFEGDGGFGVGWCHEMKSILDAQQPEEDQQEVE